MRPIDPPYEPRVAELLTKLMPADSGLEPLALFRLFAVHPELAERIRPFASGLLNHGLLPARDREIVIARTTAACDAEYEWGVHATFFAGSSGLGREEYDVLAVGGALPGEQVLVDAVDELLDAATLSESTRSALGARYDDAQVIELVLLTGWYRSIATLINAARLPVEPWAARFPAGRATAAGVPGRLE